MRAALALSLLLFASALSAQDAERDREEARALFEQGRAALEANDAPRAITLLRQSLERFPYLPTAYNLAVALESAGRPARSATLTHAILQGRFGRLDRAQRHDATTLLATVEPRVGRVQIHVVGAPDPWLRVDDDPPRPVAPDETTSFYVAPGRHAFTVGAEGMPPHRVALAIEAGQREELRIDLRVTGRGSLRVRSPENEAPVEIVGLAEGPSPLERELPVGVYEVGLAGRPGSRFNVSVEADRLRDVQVEPPPRRWPRIVGGVAAALVAVGAALAIGLSVRGGDDGPEDDPVFGTIEALRAR